MTYDGILSSQNPKITTKLTTSIEYEMEDVIISKGYSLSRLFTKEIFYFDIPYLPNILITFENLCSNVSNNVLHIDYLGCGN